MNTTLASNADSYASNESVFVLPLIPLIDYPAASAESEHEETTTSSSGADFDFDSTVEAMD